VSFLASDITIQYGCGNYLGALNKHLIKKTSKINKKGIFFKLSVKLFLRGISVGKNTLGRLPAFSERMSVNISVPTGIGTSGMIDQ